jgi:hypothetical protein
VKHILLLTVLLASNAFAAATFDETMAAAKQGAAYAQYNLGIMYANGVDVPENDAEAVKWFRKAADQGHAKAQSNLGIMYDNGEGVPENYVEAVKWYRKAADQGNVSAQINLGFMYERGMGVPENSIRAYVWWSMAKTQGHTVATENLEILKSQMTKQQIADALALAAKCFESDYKDCD